MSVVGGISTALEVSGVKEYIGHLIGGATGWLLEKLYRWWNGSRGQVNGSERDIELGMMAVGHNSFTDEIDANLDSTSVCIVSEFGVLEDCERVVKCCGWRIAASREVIHHENC